ncbi:glycosyltransferase [Pseudonocardia abyssalis]|uniref:Glycosyltransferase n=1 Tax=Pseudonocardia abyssalis TaxID=2792008 RepID=A0ABS6UU01_9PSEU|nr:glycosyltransferase [Pseudonocardia abyssalis]MBW0114581.1 glycosyltransferase [Pseudonocardia abyssalis]MBW0135728.1 glycosyltransferase [Pseudonocardia abyssalis]
MIERTFVQSAVVSSLPTQAGPVPSTGGVAHVVLPAFNEEGSLPALLARLAQTARTERLVAWVIDDGSADRTAEIATAGEPGLDVRLVSHPQNLGLGQAVQSGIRAVLAAADPDDFVVVMDADDTHDPGMIRVLHDGLDAGADVVICSRFVEGGDDSTAPPFRRLLSRGAAVTFRSALRVEGVNDFTSGFRAYRVSVLARAAKHWGERLVEEQGFACMVELLLKLRHCNPVITEVPLVLQYDRKQGASKLRLKRTIGQYVKLLVRDRLAPAPYRAL